MAKRTRRRDTRLVKAAAGIGRAIGKALNRIHKIDSDVGKVMEARGRNLQQLGRDAGRKIATLGKAGPTGRKPRRKIARRRSAPSGRRIAARRAPRRKTKR